MAPCAVSERHLDATTALQSRMDGPDILLTNDDGIEAAGLRALYERLSDVGRVTVAAPADDQSAVGRTRSPSVSVREHELGYVLEGTPVDCVVAGLHSLVPETDLVVAGCNCGANLGEAVLGRSGTVSAAVESTFLGTPAIAISMYVPGPMFADEGPDLDRATYAEAARAGAYLADRVDEAVFDRTDYLNVNAPVAARATGEMALTRPSTTYRIEAEREGDTVSISNPIWNLMATGEITDPPGTDRRTVLDGQVSVSPLSSSHTPVSDDAAETLVAEYRHQ